MKLNQIIPQGELLPVYNRGITNLQALLNDGDGLLSEEHYTERVGELDKWLVKCYHYFGIKISK